MSPEQQERSWLLKTRNIRRLQREAVEQQLTAAGLNGVPVSDERAEQLLASFKLASPVDDLRPDGDWQDAVIAFANKCFGLTVASLWDWDGSIPMYRVAAASLRQCPECLARLHPSGFWLVNDNDRQVLVVDLDFDENTQLTTGTIRGLELANA